MTLKITFLGSGSAFTVGGNFQSNLLLEIGSDSLLIDAGTDIRHSLYAQKRTHLDIHNVYISHLHADHCSGLDWLALTSHFDPNYKNKPNLYVSDQMVNDLWHKVLSGSLSTLEHIRATLDTFFNVHAIKRYEGFLWAGIAFKLVQMIHFYSEYELMPSFGLIFTYNNTRILFTADTQCTPEQLNEFYKDADIIFHDCETLPEKSGVHAHYSELKHLPLSVKNKMWLYHYNPGALPDAVKDGFLGFVKQGQCFTF
jgi:ribonuclease BN (tRNA processing enzyme)